MDNSGEQPKFEVRPVIEQKPFESPAVQSFFTRWCEINDSIQPHMMTRADWEQRGARGILDKRPDGKHTLYIPQDLQLWEMVGVMEVVDHDTFATKPERQNEAKKKILELGTTFQNAGIYIAQRLDYINEGKDIARALAEEFYGYGQSLTAGKKPEKRETIADIASHDLAEEQVATVERFLAGDSLYNSRQGRQRKTLAQFFRVSAKAFELQRKSTNGDSQKNRSLLKPWQNNAPLHNAFIAKIEKAIVRKIETPKRELENSIFRRGMELLQKNIPFDKLPDDTKNLVLHWQNGETTLRQALQIDRLKAELEAIRQSGDVAKISDKEREITDIIQIAVSSFPYKLEGNNPSEILASQYINCVGASTLGGVLLQEAGLNYLVGDLPEHSILFLVTSDGHVEWRDMLSASFNENLTDEMIAGRKKDGSPLTVADIVAFSKAPAPEGMSFDLTKSKMTWVKEGQRQMLAVFEPEYGLKIQILHNLGNALFDLGQKEEAIEAYRNAVALDPKYAYPYLGLGKAFLSLDHNEEAIEAFNQAITINPNHAHPYLGLGSALLNLGRKAEAVKAYSQAIAVDPKYVYPYYSLGVALSLLGRNIDAVKEYHQATIVDPKYVLPYHGLGISLSLLGRKEESIKAFQKFIDLSNNNEYNDYVRQAKRVIAESKK